MISAKGITKNFGSLKVLKNVSFEFKPGECIALIGPNGSGKTTLIKSILGMVVPDEGTLIFKGKEIKKDWKYRNDIGYMPQTGRYPDNMTIGQVYAMMKDIRGQQQLDTELYDAFELDKMKNKSMRTLSGGTRQKVSAALAFLFNADLLILDEPTAGLDPVSSEILRQKIKKEKEKGRLILISSHILSELDDLVSEVIYLQDGNVLFHQNIAALSARTGEEKLNRMIAKTMLQLQNHE